MADLGERDHPKAAQTSEANSTGWGFAGRESMRRDLSRARHLRNHSWGSEPSAVAFVRESSTDTDEWGMYAGDHLPPLPSPVREDGISSLKSPGPESRIPATPTATPEAGGGMKHCICMVSDFFFPDAGGVENHMYMLSQCLLQLGHKGVRWLTGGLKVYYLPLMPMPDVFSSGRVSLPTLISSFPIFRNICIRERVTIVHGHQAFSILCHENLMHASTMGLKSIFTDHSLFGFSDPSAIHMNKVLDFTLTCINHVICVSHTSKENTVLRANIEPEKVSVIPNAVDTSMFTPDPAARVSDCITIVCITRLVYRKGVDLMVEVIPAICKEFHNVNFIVGGDGPMRVALEQMRENNQLQDRVEMLGHVKHHDVRDVLVRGHIYLNCSLTEAFCIAILEAASAGLLVVSTKVGGVPEVMPSNMIKYARPDPKDLVDALKTAILKDLKETDPVEFHENVKKMYSWHNVALRTCKIYDKVCMDPPRTLVERIERSSSRGPVFGILIAVLVAMDFLFWQFLCWLYPESDIDIAVDWHKPSAAEKQASLDQMEERHGPTAAALDGAARRGAVDQRISEDAVREAAAAAASQPDLTPDTDAGMPPRQTASRGGSGTGGVLLEHEASEAEAGAQAAMGGAGGPEPKAASAKGSQGWRKFLGPAANNADM